MERDFMNKSQGPGGVPRTLEQKMDTVIDHVADDDDLTLAQIEDIKVSRAAWAKYLDKEEVREECRDHWREHEAKKKEDE